MRIRHMMGKGQRHNDPDVEEGADEESDDDQKRRRAAGEAARNLSWEAGKRAAWLDKKRKKKLADEAGDY